MNLNPTPTLVQLATHVGDQLLARKWQLTTAESCTGGLVATAITEIAGSSHWFERGFVTYSNQAKIDLLNVPEHLLETVGAVSEPVAQAMAQGALRNSQAQLALSITGIAGPGGGSVTKPVGMVCFGWTDHLHTHCETQVFPGTRQQVRAQAAAHALRGVLAWFSETH